MEKNENFFLKKKILIYGLGKTGVETFDFLKKKADVYVFDDAIIKTKNLFLKQKILNFKKLLRIKFDRIIISPGININKCKLSSVLKTNFLNVYSDLDIFYCFFKNKTFVITGTNGKSTTSKILHEVLLDQKYDSRLVGNIGNPILSEKKITNKTVFVIEASSYQLDYSKIFKTKCAIILNISPDHLERHTTLNNYIDAKFKLIKSQLADSIAFVKKNDQHIIEKIKNNTFKSKIVRVDTSNVFKILKNIKNKYFLSPGNQENLSFVLKISKLLKLNKKKLYKTLNKFKGLSYRQETIFKSKKLIIINDSKSTSFASSANLLKKLNNVYWMVGGIPKKGDKFPLFKKDCKDIKVYIFGKYFEIFNKKFQNKLIIKNHKDLKASLKNIFFDIKKEKNNLIKTIFFSPAGASFDSFKNFEERGLYFNQLVKKMINENK